MLVDQVRDTTGISSLRELSQTPHEASGTTPFPIRGLRGSATRYAGGYRESGTAPAGEPGPADTARPAHVPWLISHQFAVLSLTTN